MLELERTSHFFWAKKTVTPEQLRTDLKMLFNANVRHRGLGRHGIYLF
jgi:hypothetical protein